jgi:hypothetical protein
LLKAHDEEEKRVSTLAQQFEKQQISTSANGNFSTQTDKPVLRNIQQHSPPPKEPVQNSIVKPTMAQLVTADEEHYSDIDNNDNDSDEEDSSEDDQDAIVDQEIDNSLVEQVQKTHLQYTKLEESRFAENLAPGVRKQHGRPAPPPPAKKIPKRQPPPPPPPSQKYHNTARTQVLESNIPSPPNTTQAVIPTTSTINTTISTGPPSMPSSPPTLPPPNLPPRPSQAVQTTPIPQLPPRPSLSTLAKAHTIASGMMNSGNSNVIGRPLHASPPLMSHLSSNEDLHRSNTTSALSKNALLKAVEVPKDTPVCPDITQASRNPPLYNHEKKVILTGHKGSLFALAACRDMIFTGSHLLRTWDISSGTVLNTIGDANPNQTNEHEKVHAITVAPCGNPIEEGRYVWVAKQDTGIYIVDTRANPPIYGKKMEGHSSPVSFLLRFRNSEIWSIDESGILNVWEIDDASPLRPPLPKKVQVSRNAIAATITNSLLWMSSGRTVAVHSVLSPNDPPIPTIRLPNDLGNITALITIPYHQDCVFASHEYGKISKWEAKDGKSVKKLQVITVSMYGICTMISVGEHYVWAGYNTGMIYIYDTRPENWAVVKSWKAHAGAVNHLVVDDSGLILGEMSGRMQVVSGDSNGCVSIWDGLLTEHWRGNFFDKKYLYSSLIMEM